MTVDPTDVSLSTLAGEVAEEYEADVIFYSGDIEDAGFGKLVETVLASKRRDNVLLVLTTNGGSANAAYQIARFLQRVYAEFILYTPSYCKSAGTIVALGAHQLIMDPFSELGPLDVQLLKQNEIGARKSGLLTRSAFEGLQDAAFELFEGFMLGIMRKSGGLVSFRVAAEISASMTSALMSGVYGKIDPDIVGSDKRDLEVALHYGIRLVGYSGNADLSTVLHLVNHYPAHDFIIDDEEAKGLFKSVSFPSRKLMMLSGTLGSRAYEEPEEIVVVPLSHIDDVQEVEDVEGEQSDEGAEPADATSEAGGGDVGRGRSFDRPSNPGAGGPPSGGDGPDTDTPGKARGSKTRDAGQGGPIA